MMLPMVCTSMSTSMVSTKMVSTSSCLYSGWDTRLRTDSTCTANFISPGVICEEGERNALYHQHKS